jgi:NTE family protein
VDAREQDVVLPFKRLRLYDGGVYDNLGLEPYFDVGTRESKIANLAIYVSDAGAPLAVDRSAGALSPWRLKRLADIMSEQSRTLRVRAFYKYLESSDSPLGAYAYIGTKIDGAHTDQAKLAMSFPTSLKRLSCEQFDAIAGHGYAVARSVEEQHRFVQRLVAAQGALQAGASMIDCPH